MFHRNVYIILCSLTKTSVNYGTIFKKNCICVKLFFFTFRFKKIAFVSLSFVFRFYLFFWDLISGSGFWDPVSLPFLYLRCQNEYNSQNFISELSHIDVLSSDWNH